MTDFQPYWNDETREREKPWWIERAEDPRLLDYLRRETNLLRCFSDGLSFAADRLQAVRGVVVDLGAGVCWTTAILSRQPLVERVHALDYSHHRLFKIAPLVFEQLAAFVDRIECRCQQMSALPMSDQSADLAVFCQALYMHPCPEKMLREVHRILRPGGAVMISCESVEPTASLPVLLKRLRRARGTTIRQWRRAFSGKVPDISGRYSYRDKDYRAFIRASGFTLCEQQLSYPVFNSVGRPAINFFGVKGIG